ncbi:NAD(P)H-binding protein [Actinocrispum sp. NPDC049592]|uniref:NAD(P)-dependent oxidoreductase n=1 Tax=Actinocrispum sp. NPDC049592 TaxID=3154835 RepID=UPI00343D8B25
MKIAVVGASGMVGSRVVQEAVNRGHTVVAVFRKAPDSLPGVTTVEGDANDPGHMASLLADADAIVGATRPAPGQEHTVVATTTALLDAAASTRILVVGGAGPLRANGRLVMDSPEYVPAEWRTFAEASADQLEACRAHSADWVYLSPPAILEPGTRTGKYRRGTTTLLTTADGQSRISAEDLAVAIVDELENPGEHRHFTVAD